VFVDDLDAPTLDGGDRHHLERVLRLRPADVITVSDGQGGWRPCGLGPELRPLGPVQHDQRPRPPIGVGFALVKGDRPELVVQKLTELGVDRIAPFAAIRSIVHWDPAKAARHHARLTAVALAAAMQSRRTWLPEVAPVADFAEVVTQTAGAALAHRAGAAPSLATPFLLVGPEGGWADEELAVGLPTVDLGPHVLRAETAAIAAGVVLAALRRGATWPGASPR
jgi:16S rRNA (uracil1498-N3)-methyltransferase